MTATASARRSPKRIERAAPPHVVMSRCIGRHATRVASELGLSRSTVEKWLDGRRRSPLHRMAIIEATAHECGQSLEDAMAPTWWQAARWSHVLRPAMPVRMMGTPTERLSDLSRASGETVGVFVEAYADGVLDETERRVCREAIFRLRAAAAWLEGLVEAA